MAETQRELVPRDDGGELDTAMAFLAFARHCVVKKLDGLDDATARRSPVGSGTSLLGLVQHLTDAERYWFGCTVAGRGRPDDWDFSMEVAADRGVGEVVAAYRAAAQESDACVSALGDPGAMTAEPVDDGPKTLRWVIAHMTGETTRHAGHADILRELIDGVTGR